MSDDELVRRQNSRDRLSPESSFESHKDCVLALQLVL